MEKAYDLKDLGARLKGKGLDVAEEATKIIVHETIGWMKESAKLSPNPVDDLLALGADKVEEIVLEQVDKIDGQKDA